MEAAGVAGTGTAARCLVGWDLRWAVGLLGLLGLLIAPPAAAEMLEPVVVSANRNEVQSFRTPAAVHAVEREAIERAGPQVNLSEALQALPGVVALNRHNYAQDLQVSLRGSGARSPFGIRGSRLYVDGIPATMPDGQGQAATVSLPSAGSIEVISGPLALLYGNSAQGVIRVMTAGEVQASVARALLWTGAHGLFQWGVQATGGSDSGEYILSHHRFRTEGHRPHSAAEREQFNARVRWRQSAETTWTGILNWFEQPRALDPLGLTRAQWEANPDQTAAAALDYRTGKEVSQRQIGLGVEHRLGPDRRATAMLHFGERDVSNRLAIPLAAQNAPTSAGGIVELDRHFTGAALRHHEAVSTSLGRLETVVGIEAEHMREQRLGFVNQFGQRGMLRRDEIDGVTAVGLHALARLLPTATMAVLAGVRASEVRFRIDDRYVTASNPDDSGRRRDRALSPVLGLSLYPDDRTHLYATLGEGFESPTLTELAYAPVGSGLNLGLRPSRSRHGEIGLKLRPAGGQRLDLAAFAITTTDEIVVAASSGGRTVFTNAGRARRRGVELAWSAPLGEEWQLRAALATLDARFAEGFVSAGRPIRAGLRIPGVPTHTAFAELAWRPTTYPRLDLAFEWLHVGRMEVNDVNADRTAGHRLLNLRIGWHGTLGSARLRARLRVDNLTDRRYVGSVIVNEANGRFFEPAPGRTWMLTVAVEHAIAR